MERLKTRVASLKLSSDSNIRRMTSELKQKYSGKPLEICNLKSKPHLNGVMCIGGSPTSDGVRVTVQLWSETGGEDVLSLKPSNLNTEPSV